MLWTWPCIAVLAKGQLPPNKFLRLGFYTVSLSACKQKGPKIGQAQI